MLIEKREMRKSLIPIIALFVFGVALKAQELSSLSFDEVCVAESQSDVVYDAYDQFDTTDFSETFFLYDAVTGNPTGEMVYKNGSYYMERNGVRTLLTRSDLLRMFSPEQFRDYSKAKRQWGASIPLFAIGGCAGALVVAGAGLWLYDWVKVTHDIYKGNYDRFSNTLAFTGFLCVVAGLAVGTATFIPAFNLHSRGSSMMSSLAYDYNYSREYEDNSGSPGSGKRPASNTSMRLSIGGTSQGVGLTLRF